MFYTETFNYNSENASDFNAMSNFIILRERAQNPEKQLILPNVNFKMEGKEKRFFKFCIDISLNKKCLTKTSC